MLPYVAIGLGAVFTAAGAALLVQLPADEAELRDAPRDDQGVITSMTPEEVDELEQTIDFSRYGGPTFLAIGGLAVVGGIVWAVLDAQDAAESERAYQAYQRDAASSPEALEADPSDEDPTEPQAGRSAGTADALPPMPAPAATRVVPLLSPTSVGLRVRF